MNTSLPDTEVRAAIFTKFPQEKLIKTIENAYALIRPPDDVFYSELETSYRRMRLFLPMFLKHIHFTATPAGKSTLEALNYLKKNFHKRQFDESVPLDIVNKTWRPYVFPGPK